MYVYMYYIHDILHTYVLYWYMYVMYVCM
jgi:hypothetical protein